MTFRFVHAADLHLDTPFDGLGRAEPEIARALQDASLGAFDRLVELALDREVAFTVFAGDIYDEGERGIRAQIRFKDGIRRLSDAGICSFIVHGNHDPLAKRWERTRKDWPEKVHIFDSETPAKVAVERDGETIAVVHGVSFGQRKEERNLALEFPKAEGDAFQIGVLHCNVGGIKGHDDYAPCKVADLQKAGYDYWALGHIHQRTILQDGNPWIVYPGNLQGRSPKPSEQGPKGALVVTVEGRSVVAEPSFVPLDGIRFATLSVDVQNFTEIPDLERHLQDEAERLLAEARERSLLVRVELTGRGRVHEDLLRPGVVDGFLAGLRDQAPVGDVFVWWESVRDSTEPELDLDAIAKQQTFPAELLALLGELAASPKDLAEFVSGQVADLPVGTLEGLKASVPDPVDPELLREAAVLAVELLAGEGR